MAHNWNLFYLISFQKFSDCIGVTADITAEYLFYGCKAYAWKIHSFGNS